MNTFINLKHGALFVLLALLLGAACPSPAASSGQTSTAVRDDCLIVRYDGDGTYLSAWRIPGVIETNGIAVGPNGEVYVNINNSHRVVQYSAAGGYLNEWGVAGDIPRSIAAGAISGVHRHLALDDSVYITASSMSYKIYLALQR